MRILLVHNYYQQPGGEDEVFAEEAQLLRDHGHQVTTYTVHNNSVPGMTRIRLAGATIWNGASYRAIRERIRRERPDVVHFHNTLPLISPAAYHAARREQVPVVQTLHNYRLLCPGVLFQRDGRVCEDCLGKRIAWPAVMHGCYRESRSATAGVAATTTAHHILGTWRQTVTLYVAVTDFVRRKFVEGGFAPEKIVVKPHFARSPVFVKDGREGYALFVGRLSQEKGIRTLLDAWERHPALPPLKIIGDGPLASDVAAASRRSAFVEWLGYRTASDVRDAMTAAQMVVVPSECYETFGRVIVEAYAAGTPVVASNIGALAELVVPGRSGYVFRPGDPDDLAAQIQRMASRPETWRLMHTGARELYETSYTPKANLERLLEIYHDAVRLEGAVSAAGRVEAAI